MQTLRECLKDLRIADYYRYPIAIAFKVVDRSKSKEEVIELGHAYELFIRTLPLPEITKESADLEQVEVKRIDEIDNVAIKETNKASLINATNAEVSVLSPLPS
ncbi:10604_t:CDS:2 [Cetraspora pellucida]|uniref:10604_t:CDS:1 n=1 Tax=Cetraspora pellucida TaxID=1433469 RepID=A0A9N9ESJ7_9GLOM|nr:10604_t:CDS:2 [Cetraspora pellucida]